VIRTRLTKIMAVRIRLFRRGRKKLALYDIVVADGRSPRDGRFIEKLGNYNPNTDPATIELNADRAFDWVMNGAQPSDTARTILSNKGVMIKKHLQVGVNKGAITQEEADKKYAAWIAEKEGKITAHIDGLEKDKATAAKTRFEAETKVKEARAEAILKKQSEMIAAVEAAAKKAAAEAAGEVADASAETASEETPVEGAVTEEAAPEAVAEPVEAKEEAAPEAVAEPVEAKEKAAPEAVAEPVEAKEKAAPEAATKEAVAEPVEAKEAAAPEAKEKAAPEAVAEPVEAKEEAATEEAKEEGKKD
jgi:small subunit ribosomal protein S16